MRHSDEETIAVIIGPPSAITGQSNVHHSDEETITVIIGLPSATRPVMQFNHQDGEMSTVFDDDISTFLEFMDDVFVNDIPIDDISIDDILNYDSNGFMSEVIFFNV